MKIGIYSDLHLSRTSSIMPLYTKDSGKYTTRLKMMLDTAEWMYEEFNKHNVDLIVNCGDTLDSSNLNAEEITVLGEFYSKSKGIEEIHILGNHEIGNVNKSFYSSFILNSFDNISVYSEPIRLSDEISLLPYMFPNEITYDLLKSISSRILFSHIDINGSLLRDSYVMDKGVDPEYLTDNFNLVINGHLHTAETVVSNSNSEVRNIGSVSSVSFVDNNEYIPSICILDTDKISEGSHLLRIKNPCSILFRKRRIKSVSDLISYLNNISNYKYILNIVCSHYIKNDLKDILDKDERIIAYRITSEFNTADIENSSDNIKINNSIDNLNIKEEFIKYLESIKYNNIEKCIDIMKLRG